MDRRIIITGLLLLLMLGGAGCADEEGGEPDSADDPAELDCEGLLDQLSQCGWEWFETQSYETLLFVCQGVDEEFFSCIDQVRERNQSCADWLALIDQECKVDTGEQGPEPWCDCF